NLEIDQIFSVVQRSNITVAGSLTDTDSDTGIEGMQIDFAGTGALDLNQVISTPDGLFSLGGSSPDDPLGTWTVQAIFAGNDLYSGSSSGSVSYDTVSNTTDSFDVSAGNDSHVDLPRFNASMDFESVLEDGKIFV